MPTAQDLDGQDVIAARRDPAAFASLFDRYIQSIYRYVYPGPSPQIDQAWRLDQTLEVAGSEVRLVGARLADLGGGALALEFEAEVDPQAIADLRAYVRDDGPCGGGGGPPDEHLTRITTRGLLCSGTIPHGPLDVAIGSAVLWGSWEASWEP